MWAVIRQSKFILHLPCEERQECERPVADQFMDILDNQTTPIRLLQGEVCSETLFIHGINMWTELSTSVPTWHQNGSPRVLWSDLTSLLYSTVDAK